MHVSAEPTVAEERGEAVVQLAYAGPQISHNVEGHTVVREHGEEEALRRRGEESGAGRGMAGRERERGSVRQEEDSSDTE